MSKVYLCTAIPYVNGNPHIGHAMDYLLADSYARYRRLLGDEVRFQVGTDEHGNKVFSTAAKNGVPVEQYVQENSDKFRTFIDQLDISYTDFVRTTDPDHVRACQAVWEKLTPHIYSAEYDGWYCEGCERFVTEKEYTENHGECPDHCRPYQKLSERNYYLRISDFKDQIRQAIISDQMHIWPEFRKQEMLKLLEDAPDISISRPRKQLSWGVPVPGDEDQVMYVWIDALSNYISVLGYPDGAALQEFWPATAQFVGKDILRFHAITWPAILLGIGLELPRNIVAHGHVLSNGQKMSKSIGNVIDPMEVLSRKGLPAFRYFFLRHIDSFADSDFTDEKYESAYNNELANDLGNLVQRLATLCQKNQVSGVNVLLEIPSKFRQLMDNFELSHALDHVWSKIQELNRRIDEAKPWELAKTGQTAQAQAVLMDLAKDLVKAAQLLQIFLPETATQIINIFTTDIIIPPATPLFPKSSK